LESGISDYPQLVQAGLLSKRKKKKVFNRIFLLKTKTKTERYQKTCVPEPVGNMCIKLVRSRNLPLVDIIAASPGHCGKTRSLSTAVCAGRAWRALIHTCPQLGGQSHGLV
jgi:hypothetical protein